MSQRELKPAYSSYTHLADMLTRGWQIEPPVYVRPRWQSRARSTRQNTYHFVLRNRDRFSLISVFDCPEVRGFLEQEELVVDQL